MVWVEDVGAGLILVLVVLGILWVWFLKGISDEMDCYEREP
jgi:hypothetical protein